MGLDLRWDFGYDEVTGKCEYGFLLKPDNEGAYYDFRRASAGDLPDGSTAEPVLHCVGPFRRALGRAARRSVTPPIRRPIRRSHRG